MSRSPISHYLAHAAAWGAVLALVACNEPSKRPPKKRPAAHRPDAMAPRAPPAQWHCGKTTVEYCYATASACAKTVRGKCRRVPRAWCHAHCSGFVPPDAESALTDCRWECFPTRALCRARRAETKQTATWIRLGERCTEMAPTTTPPPGPGWFCAVEKLPTYELIPCFRTLSRCRDRIEKRHAVARAFGKAIELVKPCAPRPVAICSLASTIGNHRLSCWGEKTGCQIARGSAIELHQGLRADPTLGKYLRLAEKLEGRQKPTTNACVPVR